MYLQLYVIFIIYAISKNRIHTQDFFQAQLSPSTLTSVPYLDGEVTVYEHLQNRSRLYVPPLAVLYLNQTEVLYNRLNKKYLLRLSLILYTNELRTTILQYVSNTRDRCSPPKEICDIKMVPTERYRVVWTRTNEFSSDYKVDKNHSKWRHHFFSSFWTAPFSCHHLLPFAYQPLPPCSWWHRQLTNIFFAWQSNTALLNKVDVHIECTTNQTCYDLLIDILAKPVILNGLELEYTTQNEKKSRKTVTITGQHVMKTNMYSQLKQLPSSTAANHMRYLLVDDMNQLVTEILTTMELEEITDSDYITHDDQKTLADLLRQRLSLSIETLHGHTERQWNSVYWNSDNIRPDRIVHLLNDELQQSQNKTSLGNKNEAFTQHQENQQLIGQNRSYDSHDNSENEVRSNQNKVESFIERAGSNSTGQKIVDQNGSDQSQANAVGQSQSNSFHRDRSFGGSYSANANVLGIAGGGFSAGFQETKIDAGSNSGSNYGSNEWRKALSKYTDRSHDNSHGWKDTQATNNDLSSYKESAWRRAATQDRQEAHDDARAQNDAQSFQELIQKNFDYYANNRQFIEFTGEKYIVKPVKAYKMNLATFHENTKFVHKTIVVSHIDLTHAVPFRILSSSSDAMLARVPVIDNYTNVFESKLDELNQTHSLGKLAMAHMNMSFITIENNFKNLTAQRTSQFIELKNNVGNLTAQTTSQFIELKNNVGNLTAQTTSQFIELKNNVGNLTAQTTSQFIELKNNVENFTQLIKELHVKLTADLNKKEILLIQKIATSEESTRLRINQAVKDIKETIQKYANLIMG
ncbi:unnamed protein product [Rotaria magnacalcarata]|uniref:Uncharacterized protein n=1 Tax=Rotaria magnacalcarata TaxID=392030 RepID=A0A8S2KLK9_9BILA|nr:unnamed protein product [Rotaria magnacalcarata]